MYSQPQPGGRAALLLRTLARTLAAAVVVLAITLASGSQEPAGLPPVQVKIADEKPTGQPVAVEHSGPIDPTQHVQLQSQGNMMVQVRVDNQMLHLGFIQTVFKVDGQVMYPGNPPSQIVKQNQPLPKKQGKQRTGFLSECTIGKLTITQEIEVVPTKAAKPGQKRRLDSAMITYYVENKDTVAHTFGARIFMDVYIVNNDGALFAAPNQPGKILDGVELKGKTLPNYVQFLQQPNLQNPGFVAHMTLNFGHGYDMADRVVLTRLGAFVNQWDLAAMQAGGDSAMGVFWEPKEIKPGARRKIAYAFGKGLAPSPEGEGNVDVVLGGSFEPGKLFTVSAFVHDPAPGQTLALELPADMERIEGKERQPVPVPGADDDGKTMVLWKARVHRTGRYNLRVHSSNGVTSAKTITISRPGEKTARP